MHKNWSEPVRQPFVLLELGFGLGVNFVNTMLLWRQQGSPGRLVYVALEKHPLTRPDLHTAWSALAASEQQSLPDALLAQWPEPSGGTVRLNFDNGSVTLLLIIGDARHLMRTLNLQADAVFLDGFSPALNEDAWQAPVLKAIGRCCKPNARLATYSAAPVVRKHLAEAGFVTDVLPGFGGKRHRIEAHYEPHWARPTTGLVRPGAAARDPQDLPASNPVKRPPIASQPRTALVIGGGLAGCATTRALLRRGWKVSLFDDPGTPLRGSSQPMVIEHLHVSPDDNLLARLTRSAWQLARSGDWYPPMTPAERSPTADHGTACARRVGKLMLIDDAHIWSRWQHALPQLRLPPGYVRLIDHATACSLAEWPLLRAHPRCVGALYFADVTAADPRRLGKLWRSAAWSCGREPESINDRVIELKSTADGWLATTAKGATHASIAVVCAAQASSRLVPLRSLPTTETAGQATELSSPARAPKLALGGVAYVCPMGERFLAGATFEPPEQFQASDTGDLSNLMRLSRSLGEIPADDEALRRWCETHGLKAVARHSGVRSSTRDRLPVIGTWPDESAALRERNRLMADGRTPLPVLRGLYGNHGYGARGLLWAVLGAEVLAAMIEDEPLPIASDLAQAITPTRGVRSWLRAQAD